MVGKTRCVGLMLAWVGGCASAPQAPNSGASTADPSGAAAADPTSFETEADAQIDRDLALHAQRVDHGDPAERLVARVDLADAMLRRASRIEVTRFEIQERRRSATGSQHADLDRLDADLVAQHAQWVERAEVHLRAVLASSDPTADSLRANARYVLAEVLTLQGKTDEALANRMALIRDAPDDPLTGSTLLLLGDEAFHDTKLERADALYLRAALFDDPGVRYYSVYKRGWIALNEGRDEDALTHWFRVAKEARREPSLQSLAEMATKDCVLAYPQVGRPARAKAFFDRLDPELTPTLLRHLAAHYRHEGRDDDAAIIDAAIQSGTPPEPTPTL